MPSSAIIVRAPPTCRPPDECRHSFLTHRGFNALAESVIGLFKTEIIHRRGPWRTLEAVEFATLEWVDWFNTRRLLEPIGYVPPAEYEARYYEQAAVA
jgi:transposase InsO family protein